MTKELTTATKALLLETARRAGERGKLAALVGKMLRRERAGAVLADTLRRALRMVLGAPPSGRDLALVMADLGAYQGQRDGRRAWFGVVMAHERLEAAAAPVARAWEKRLAEEGMGEPDAVDSRIPDMIRDRMEPQGPKGSHERLVPRTGKGMRLSEAAAAEGLRLEVEATQEFYSRLRAYYWSHDWKSEGTGYVSQKVVFRMYAIDGLSSEKIGPRCGMTPQNVRLIIAKHRAKAGIIR